MSEQSPIAREMTTGEILKSRFVGWCIRFRRRWIPYVIWHNSEIDVVVTFKENPLPEMEFSDGDDMGLAAMRLLHEGALPDIERKLNEIGIEFDKGMGGGGRDWEWDFSLRGPISVRLRGPASKPERRK